MIELAKPCFRIGRDHALGQLGMKRALHARGVAGVPTLDVIEGRLRDRGVVIGSARLGKSEGVQQNADN